MKKLLIGIVVIVAVVAMAKTVPDKKAHKKAMMEAVKEYVDEEATERMGDNVLTGYGKGYCQQDHRGGAELETGGGQLPCLQHHSCEDG